jgi:hypothetical protein
MEAREYRGFRNANVSTNLLGWLRRLVCDHDFVGHRLDGDPFPDNADDLYITCSKCTRQIIAQKFFKEDKMEEKIIVTLSPSELREMVARYLDGMGYVADVPTIRAMGAGDVREVQVSKVTAEVKKAKVVIGAGGKSSEDRAAYWEQRCRLAEAAIRELDGPDGVHGRGFLAARDEWTKVKEDRQ